MPHSRPHALALLALGLAACADRLEVCATGQDPAAKPLQRPERAGLHAFTHAHNDYQHEKPLDDALQARFYSVEVDVYFAGGTFEVSHLGFVSDGLLRDLYLVPLQRRVSELGSVHGDGVPFHLWIDLKDEDPKLVQSLETILREFPMFSRFGEGAKPGAVTAILTGNDAAKRAFVDELPVRHAARDSNFFSIDDPAADDKWRFYALPWSEILDWSGDGPLDAEERRRLHCVVESAHAKGRKVRLYAAPDNRDTWQLLVDSGVDFINSDDLAGLSAFADAR